MSDTPSKPITLSTATNSSDADPAVAEASKVTPVKVTPVKLTPAKPAAATNNAAAKKPRPVSTASKSAITFDDDSAAAVSTPMLLVDGLAAVVAIAFAVMILLDAKPFL